MTNIGKLDHMSMYTADKINADEITSLLAPCVSYSTTGFPFSSSACGHCLSGKH